MWGQGRHPANPACSPWHRDPKISFSRDSIRALDRLALEEFGIPGVVLMENAAIRVAEFAVGVLPPDRGVLVLCGPGNNGGDGLAAARHLANAGVPVALVLAGAGSRVGSDAALNLSIARRMGLAMFDADAQRPEAAMDEAAGSLGKAGVGLVIDALLGTGLSKPAAQPVRGLIERTNQLSEAGAGVLSVDLPSGMDADSGAPAGGEAGCAVRAAWTVTLVGRKTGFDAPGASQYLGEVHVADIGVPRELVHRLGRTSAGNR